MPQLITVTIENLAKQKRIIPPSSVFSGVREKDYGKGALTGLWGGSKQS